MVEKGLMTKQEFSEHVEKVHKAFMKNHPDGRVYLKIEANRNPATQLSSEHCPLCGIRVIHCPGLGDILHDSRQFNYTFHNSFQSLHDEKTLVNHLK